MTYLANRYIASANVLGASLAMLNTFVPLQANAQPLIPVMPYSHADDERHKFSNISRTEPSLRPLLAKIECLADLVMGWDGPGSVRPTDQTIAKAVAFVSSIPASVTPPELAAAGDGEISLFWRTDKLFVDVSVGSDGAAAFAHVDGLSYKVRAVSVLHDLPSVVLQAVSRI